MRPTSQMPLSEREELYADVRRLTGIGRNHLATSGRSQQFQRFDLLTAINRTARAAAMAASGAVRWDDEDTARVITNILVTTGDEEFSARGLLAVKIMAGFRSVPEDDARVSGIDPNLTWNFVREGNPELFKKGASFETSKQIRHLFAAPLYGGNNKNHFARPEPNFVLVANEFLDEVFRRVQLEAEQRAGSPRPEAAPSAEEGTKQQAARGADATGEIPSGIAPLVTNDGATEGQAVEQIPAAHPSRWSRARRFPISRVTGAVVLFALVAMMVGTMWMTSLQQSPPPSSSGSVSPPGEASAPEPAVVTNINQVPLDSRCPSVQPDPDREVRLLLAQRDGCWSSSVRLTAGSPVFALVHFKSQASVQQDNVTARLELPSGVRIVDGTTYWGNYSEPTGTLALDATITEDGVNVGSYVPGANVWWLVELAASGSSECGGEVRALITTAQSATDRDDSAYATLVPCGQG